MAIRISGFYNNVLYVQIVYVWRIAKVKPFAFLMLHASIGNLDYVSLIMKKGEQDLYVI